MPQESLVKTNLGRRLRVVALGVQEETASLVFDELRRECVVEGCTLEFRQLDTPSELLEHLTTARLDMLVLDRGVDEASVWLALGRLGSVSPALLAGIRVYCVTASVAETDLVGGTIGALRAGKGPGTTHGHWADGVRDRPKGARTFVG